jgi:hypothetical protein
VRHHYWRETQRHAFRSWLGRLSHTRLRGRECVVLSARWPLATAQPKAVFQNQIDLAGRLRGVGTWKSGGLGNKMRGYRMAGARCQTPIRWTSQKLGTACCLEQTRFDSFVFLPGAASCQREERLWLFHEPSVLCAKVKKRRRLL